VKDELHTLKQEIIRNTHQDTYEPFLTGQDDYYEKATFTSEKTRKKKLTNLEQKHHPKTYNQNWIENLTSERIPENVANYLSLGKNFVHNPGVQKAPVFELIADVEGILKESSRSRSKNETDTTRARIANTIQNHVIRNDANIDADDRRINLLFNETKKFLAQKELEGKLTITESDKGKKTVILYTQDYNASMEEMLSDRSRFLHLRKDPTNEIQKKAENLIKKLEKKGHLTGKEAKKLIIRYPKAPRFYGLPKTHKSLYDEDGQLKLKMRPITSFIDSPLYMISKYLASILTKVNEDSEFDLKNSYECAEKLKSIQLPPGYILISLDVTALFDSIPPQLAKKAIEDEWDTIKEHTNIPRQLFMDLFELCLENSYFLYKDNIYKVKIGVPMGASSSVPISSIVMNILLRIVLKKLPFEVPLCFRFVDDLLLGVPADQVETTLEIFNGYNNWIKFTVEIEKDGVLPFLDMEIHRDDDGRISTVWYSKPTATNRMINYYSNHSFTTKLNCVQGLINRVFRLTTKSDMESWKISKCYEILGKNQYPSYLIRRFIHRHKNRTEDPGIPRQAEETPKSDKKYRSVVYIKGVSDKISRIFKQTSPEFQICFRSSQRTNRFFTRLKDPIDPMKIHNIVYEISCQIDCDEVYRGMSTNTLNVRLNGHQSSLNKLDKAVTPEQIERATEATALVKHAHITGHKFDLQNARILIHTKNPRKLPVLEMLEIGSHPKTVNLKSDTNNLNKNYSAIVDRFRRMTAQQLLNKRH
jgi:hypothetical protein